jgi:hypothetical protein
LRFSNRFAIFSGMSTSLESGQILQTEKSGTSRSSLKRRISRALLALLVLGAAWFFWPRHADLRGFDPARTARLETSMWRSYYEHRRFALVRDLYRLARREYGFSPYDSTRIAWHAARAALAFQPTHSREEAQVALPALEKYFRVIARGARAKFVPAQAAREELDWWQLRREQKPWPEYAAAVARVTATIYSTTEERVLEAARIRSEMMEERDRRRDTVMTATDWQQIETGLKRSWTALKQTVGK